MENFLIKYLIFTIIFLCCCLIYFHKYKIKLTLQGAEKSMDKFFQYLDKYYVINIWLTTFNVILYIALNLLLVICLRIYILKDLLKINDNISLEDKDFLFVTILKIILILIILFLLSILLKLIFNTSLLKLHVFLYTKKYYRQLIKMLHPYYLLDFFGKIYLFLDNIVKEQTLRDLNNTEKYMDIYFYDEIYESHRIQKLSNILIYLTKKSIVIFLLFILLRNIFKWLYTHITLDRFLPFIPKIIFSVAIIYNFTQLNIYYTIDLFYCYYLTIKIIDYLKFIQNKTFLTNDIINNYFYKSNYKNNRIYLKTNFTYFINLIIQDKNNNAILREIKTLSLVEYVLNDFNIPMDPETQKLYKSLNSLYKRFFILALVLIAIHYFYNNKYYVIFINNDITISFVTIFILIFFLLLFISKKTRKSMDLEQEAFDCRSGTYEHSKFYNILFWIITIISFSFIYVILTISKVNIIDILFNSPYIKIIRELTMEEKYHYFYDYLETVLLQLQDIENTEDHIDNMRYIIEELHWKEFITKESTLADVRELINTFVNLYLDHVSNHYLKYIEKQKGIKAFMDCFTNITIQYIFSKFFIMYISAWHLTNNPTTSNTIKLIHWIIKSIF